MFRFITPVWFLRLGLGLMYLYSGLDIVRHPSSWHWAVTQFPDWLEKIPNSIGIDRFLTGQGIAELIFAAVLIIPFMPRFLVRLVAFLSVLEMAAILVFVGVDAITFRDIGLLGAALALLVSL